MKIAITTFNTHYILAKKTLKLLKQYEIDEKNIYIFLYNDYQPNYYASYIQNSEYNVVVTHCLNEKTNREFISNYFSSAECTEEVIIMYDYHDDINETELKDKVPQLYAL